jgi:hypothetical protein
MEKIADRLVLPLGTLWILLGWGIALIPSLQTETARVLASLNRSAEQLREELVRLNTAYRLQQQAIARALHGLGGIGLVLASTGCARDRDLLRPANPERSPTAIHGDRSAYEAELREQRRLKDAQVAEAAR